MNPHQRALAHGLSETVRYPTSILRLLGQIRSAHEGIVTVLFLEELPVTRHLRRNPVLARRKLST
jgi:hypothetical protein